MMIPVFIGYDYREPIAFHVCSNSIIRNAKRPVSIIPLALNLLDKYNEIHDDGSNEFTYTRFLVPYLTNYAGHAIYIDGDMVVKSDISELYDLRDNNYAVQVVKHNYTTSKSIKYLNNKNEDYPMKNWSSVILWNCEHVLNKTMTPMFVQNASGSQLHQFKWLPNKLIGSLPIEWNWLCDEYGHNDNAKLIHYTLGIPSFSGSNTNHTDEWHDEVKKVTFCKEQ